jgi:hypothetical protein
MPIATKTIVLLTSDDGLAERVRRAVGVDEHLLRIRGLSAVIPSMVAGDRHLAVLDCRALDRAGTENALAVLRAELGSSQVPIVAICELGTVTALDIIGTLGSQVTELILADRESLCDLLRAILNDPSRTASAALALDLLSSELPQATAPVLEAVLASGLHVTSVKEACKVLARDPASLSREMRFARAPSPTEIVELAKALFAIALLRTSPLSNKAVAQTVGYSSARWLNRLLERVFHLSIHDIRAESAAIPTRVFLGQLLARRRQGIHRTYSPSSPVSSATSR